LEKTLQRYGFLRQELPLALDQPLPADRFLRQDNRYPLGEHFQLTQFAHRVDRTQYGYASIVLRTPNGEPETLTATQVDNLALNAILLALTVHRYNSEEREAAGLPPLEALL
jgi:hypothetical protein